MAAPPLSDSITFSKVLSESRRIIKLHSRHFFALSLLFLLPLSSFSLFSLILQRNLHPYDQPDHDSDPSSSLQTHKNFQAFSSTNALNLNLNPYNYLLLSLLISLLTTLFSIFASASISYSVNCISQDKPVDLVSSLKSILRSFWPLVTTAIIIGLIGILIFIPFFGLMFLAYKWLSHYTPYSLVLVLVIDVILFAVAIFVQTNWILAYVVVVVESKRGFAALKRGAYLIKGNRGVALSMILYIFILTAGMMWTFSGVNFGGWGLLLYFVCCSFFASQIMLLGYVGTAVLYGFCRESHEGLPISEDPTKVPLLK